MALVAFLVLTGSPANEPTQVEATAITSTQVVTVAPPDVSPTPTPLPRPTEAAADTELFESRSLPALPEQYPFTIAVPPGWESEVFDDSLIVIGSTAEVRDILISGFPPQAPFEGAGLGVQQFTASGIDVNDPASLQAILRSLDDPAAGLSLGSITTTETREGRLLVRARYSENVRPGTVADLYHGVVALVSVEDRLALILVLAAGNADFPPLERIVDSFAAETRVQPPTGDDSGALATPTAAASFTPLPTFTSAPPSTLPPTVTPMPTTTPFATFTPAPTATPPANDVFGG